MKQFLMVFLLAILGTYQIAFASSKLGPFKCTLRETDAQAFKMGDQIVLGVNGIGMGWVSTYGMGLESESCEEMGDNVICSAAGGTQTLLFAWSNLEFTRKFNYIPASTSEVEKWSCERLQLQHR